MILARFLKEAHRIEYWRLFCEKFVLGSSPYSVCTWDDEIAERVLETSGQ